MLRDEKPMNINGLLEIVRNKEFASCRAENARGCFGSNKVSKIANKFSSRNSDICLCNENFQRRITVF